MADMQEIVETLAAEFGKTSSTAKRKIEAWAGEVVVDLLSQNEGRFKMLEVTETITIDTTNTDYLLPADFNTAKETFIEVDSEGDYLAECACVTKKRILRHRQLGKYVGHRLTYIKEKQVAGSTPGFYLVLASLAAEATIFEFDYYRTPTVADIHVIRKPAIIKIGVRGLAAEFNPNAGYHAQIYERHRIGFAEAPERFLTRLEILPARRTADHNRRMRRYGGGY